jgi:hypothetical protein
MIWNLFLVNSLRKSRKELMQSLTGTGNAGETLLYIPEMTMQEIANRYGGVINYASPSAEAGTGNMNELLPKDEMAKDLLYRKNK